MQRLLKAYRALEEAETNSRECECRSGKSDGIWCRESDMETHLRSEERTD